MVAYTPEPERIGRNRQIRFALAVVIVSAGFSYLPEAAQQRIALSVQATVLRPFIATQELFADARMRSSQTELLLRDLDSLTSVTSTQSALVDENRTLRGLLGLGERIGPAYLPASVLRPGTAGSESMFLVDVGYEDGVRTGAPVVGPHGLLGQIRDVQPGIAVGIDWTHPDFRASAMLVDGEAFGIVENVRGAFREQDQLMLNGTAYNQLVGEGMLVVTSGLGGVFPRGIPIGRIQGIAEEQGSWRKSYWLQPNFQPGSATHVLVAVVNAPGDMADMWTDSLETEEEDTGRAPEL